LPIKLLEIQSSVRQEGSISRKLSQNLSDRETAYASVVVSIAQKYLGDEQRISFHIEDAGTFLEQIEKQGSSSISSLLYLAGKYTILKPHFTPLSLVVYISLMICRCFF